jgi:hypothetical protein
MTLTPGLELWPSIEKDEHLDFLLGEKNKLSFSIKNNLRIKLTFTVTERFEKCQQL